MQFIIFCCGHIIFLIQAFEQYSSTVVSLTCTFRDWLSCQQYSRL